MKKIKLLFIVVMALTLFSGKLSAQLIHVDGSKALGLNAGYVKGGVNISARLSLYDKRSLTYRVGFDFETVNVSLTKARLIYANPEVMYTFYSIGENLFFSANAGLIMGVEMINNSILEKNKSKFIIGENIGLCVEYYLSERIMLNLDADQRFFQMSSLGNASFIVKFGINYNF